VLSLWSFGRRDDGPGRSEPSVLAFPSEVDPAEEDAMAKESHSFLLAKERATTLR
jgi:hypothetical protein